MVWKIKWRSKRQSKELGWQTQWQRPRVTLSTRQKQKEAAGQAGLVTPEQSPKWSGKAWELYQYVARKLGELMTQVGRPQSDELVIGWWTCLPLGDYKVWNSIHAHGWPEPRGQCWWAAASILLCILPWYPICAGNTPLLVGWIFHHYIQLWSLSSFFFFLTFVHLLKTKFQMWISKRHQKL